MNDHFQSDGVGNAEPKLVLRTVDLLDFAKHSVVLWPVGLLIVLFSGRVPGGVAI